ncbi:hypothetical protein KM043_011713 [Ampulex compressa]|uniref:Venom protein n=1 Tax=Ampulex compressa TaxID=860918 RepID=A0A1W6EW36_AMPCP|nr:venom protein [Ampulex compressa]KAG7210152.1 hypothetical protein KM043_011713 [Ampulex compressa]
MALFLRAFTIIIILIIFCSVKSKKLGSFSKRTLVLTQFRHPGVIVEMSNKSSTHRESKKEGKPIECFHDYTMKVPNPNMKFPLINKCCDFIRNCTDYILPGTWKYDLGNDEDYKVVDCMCDSEFTQCLYRVSHKNPEYEFAHDLLNIYRNEFKPKCFLKVYKLFCERHFYDLRNNSYTDNDYGDLFCASWYHPYK